MKAYLYSDLHIEHKSGIFKKFPVGDTSNDLLILAGDILEIGVFSVSTERSDTIKERADRFSHLFSSFFKTCSEKFKHVIYVTGNHEHYHSIIDDAPELLKLELKKYPNITYLDSLYGEKEICIGDTVFVGGTLWTSFDNGNPVAMQYCATYMNDYFMTHKRYVNDPTALRLLRPADTYDMNVEYFNEIKNIVEKYPNKDVVIVTHHAPTTLSVPKRYIGDKSNAAYASSYGDFIADHPQIKIWCHGHMHSRSSYKVGDSCIVYANPAGYPGEDTGFDRNFFFNFS